MLCGLCAFGWQACWGLGVMAITLHHCGFSVPRWQRNLQNLDSGTHGVSLIPCTVKANRLTILDGENKVPYALPPTRTHTQPQLQNGSCCQSTTTTCPEAFKGAIFYVCVFSNLGLFGKCESLMPAWQSFCQSYTLAKRCLHARCGGAWGS